METLIMARSDRLHILCMVLVVCGGCKSRSGPRVPASAPTPGQPDLRNSLLLVNKPRQISGDKEDAGAYEQWASNGTLDSVEKIEIAALTANGWQPLKKNAPKWKAHPINGRRMLGYKKNDLYYVMFIRPSSESKEQPVHVIHVVAHKISLTNSSGYFLP